MFFQARIWDITEVHNLIVGPEVSSKFLDQCDLRTTQPKKTSSSLVRQ